MDSVILPRYLLLLSPWYAGSPTQEELRAAYGPALTSVLSQLSAATRNGTLGACIEIVLPLPFLHSHQNEPRSRLYGYVQPIVAGIYKLICIIAAKEHVNVEDSEGIDVRLVLLTHPGNDHDAKDDASGSSLNGKSSLGPIVSLQALARCQRQWQSVYVLGGEDCDRLLHEFLVAQDSHVNIKRVSGGKVLDAARNFELATKESRLHSSIAVGGTWDHIHIGHKLLLTMFAFMLQPQEGMTGSLTVGITGDELLRNKKHAEVLESWHDRQRAVIRFLQAIMDFRPSNESNMASKELNDEGPNGHAVHYTLADDVVIKLVEIVDPFGPTITDESISALVLSAETRSGGKAVNEKREAQGWEPLEVLEVDVLDAEESGPKDGGEVAFESKLSSTNIRKNIAERGKTRSKA